MNSKKVYLLLTDTGTLFTRLIKMYTKNPYNHASLSFDKNLKEVYSFGRKRPRNPFIGGFVKEDVKAGLFKNARCTILSCTVTVEQYENMKRFLEKIEADKHLYRYNLLGVFAFALNKQIKRDYAYFCSEFVATILHEAGVVNFQKPLSFVSPEDLQNLENFQIEFQGDLAQLYSGAPITSLNPAL